MLLKDIQEHLGMPVVELTEKGKGDRFVLPADGHIRRVTSGTCTALVPARVDYATAHGVDAKTWPTPVIVEYQAELLPSKQEMKYVFDVLFGAYSHETLCMWGRARKDGKTWKKGEVLFYVPEQEVQGAHVAVVDDNEIAKFVSVAKIYGDIHSHPWPGKPMRSQTDVRDMEEGMGLHAIVSSAGHVVWYASVKGGHEELETWMVAQEKPISHGRVLTSNAASLDSRMKPVRHAGFTHAEITQQGGPNRHGKYRGGRPAGYGRGAREFVYPWNDDKPKSGGSAVPLLIGEMDDTQLFTRDDDKPTSLTLESEPEDFGGMSLEESYLVNIPGMGWCVIPEDGVINIPGVHLYPIHKLMDLTGRQFTNIKRGGSGANAQT